MKTQTNRVLNRIGFVRAIPKDVEDTRTIPFVISNSTRDRHRTVLNMKNWELDNYRDNPIVGYQHQVYGGYAGTDPDYVIGTSDVQIERKELVGAVKFEPEEINPLAEKIFRKVLHGTLRAASVGFIPKGIGKYGDDDEAEGKENETYYYAGQELLEWSIVNIPSNPKAVKKNILNQFGELLLSYFPVDEINKMTVEELLRYSEAVERETDDEVYVEKYNFHPEPADERPYANEHAARLKDPKDFADNPVWSDGKEGKFRRTTTNTYLGKKSKKQFDVIWGKLKDKAGKDDEPIGQAIRFKKDAWTPAEAKKWLDDNNITYILFEPAAEKNKNYQLMRADIELFIN